jgi:superoxide reductase
MTMTEFQDLFQSADWKTEKHVPVIEAPDSVSAGEIFPVTASVGKEVPHPNQPGHHIRWITLYFLPQGDKFPLEVGHVDFSAHGESAKKQESEESGVFSHPSATFQFKTDKPGTLYASSYCNIHGLWKNSKELSVS